MKRFSPEEVPDLEDCPPADGDKARNQKSRSDKPDNRKEFRSCGFPVTLNKIEEVDETHSKIFEKIVTDENGNLKLRRDASQKQSKERPRSAGPVTSFGFSESKLKKRPRSFCTLLQSSRLGVRRRPKSAGANLFEIKGSDPGGPQWCDLRYDSPQEEMYFLSRSSSRCESRLGTCLCGCRSHCGRDDATMQLCHCTLESQRPRKCRSNPSFSRNTLEKCEQALNSKKDLHKFKRSLKLLGFELSDFGIYGNGIKRSPRRRLKETSSTLSTKITGRSVSLDSLRQAVRKAWVYDGLDSSHRRLLAQAAYEQWYFKKEGEFMKKREEERMQRMRRKEDVERELWKKKAKSEEEFKKWMQRKRAKRKEKEEMSAKKSEKSFTRLVKTKEESDKAFLKWKREKDKELKMKAKEKRREEEQKMEAERQKLEKKVLAEKVFRQWKMKRDENLREEAERLMRLKKEAKEVEKRRVREEGRHVSYETWKRLKEEKIREKLRLDREAVRIAKEERLTQMEERMYEAEQAFEEWLDKLDLRRQKLFSSFVSYQKKVPWLPI